MKALKILPNDKKLIYERLENHSGMERYKKKNVVNMNFSKNNFHYDSSYESN